jgi:hypothetical protein
MAYHYIHVNHYKHSHWTCLTVTRLKGTCFYYSPPCMWSGAYRVCMYICPVRTPVCPVYITKSGILNFYYTIDWISLKLLWIIPWTIKMCICYFVFWKFLFSGGAVGGGQRSNMHCINTYQNVAGIYVTVIFFSSKGAETQSPNFHQWYTLYLTNILGKFRGLLLQ